MTSFNICRYCIAGHLVELSSALNQTEIEAVAPSLIPFRCDDSGQNPLFAMRIYDVNSEHEEAHGELEYRNIGDFDTGNGHMLVDKCDETGGYRILIRDMNRREGALLWASADFKSCSCRLLCTSRAFKQFALNNALMMAYAFAGAAHRTVLMHASCVVANSGAYAFIAKSGTGKSTQTGNWLSCFEDADLLNDDNPVVRVTDDGVYVYGSPWSGKTPCYRNECAPLRAVASIVRDSTDYVVKLGGAQALVSLVNACSTMRWDKDIYRGVIDTATQIVARVGVYALHCLPHPESAIVCRRSLEK